MFNVIKLSPYDKIEIDMENKLETNEFDIDKWLEQYPPDYIKSVKILNNFPRDLKLFAFKHIFKIFRCYLPDVLYKYYSFTNDQKLNEIKIDTLAKNRVYLSDLSQFNDPFDGRAIFYNTDELNKFDILKEYKGVLIDDFASYNISTSLSAAGSMNMSMWAHYANNHKGYCVSYKKTENEAIGSFTFPIQYLNTRIDITDYLVDTLEYFLNEKEKPLVLGEKEMSFNDITLVLVILLLSNIKGIDWKYEKEYRISLAKMNNSRYLDLKPFEIFIGKDCDKNNENSLIDIAKKQNINIYKLFQGDVKDGFNIKYRQIFME